MQAEAALRAAELIVGYGPYLERIADLVDPARQETYRSGMRQETERCAYALRAAEAGREVALISSGDAGVYGMAGLAIEMRAALGLTCPVEVVAGVTAASALAARVGAPLMLDAATVSLSDLLAPWEAIRRRLEAALAADFVLCLYNPKSRSRLRPWEEALELIAAHRAPTTPVALGHAVGQPDERVWLSDVARLPEEPVDMKTVLIVGNATGQVLDGFFVTPRGYDVAEDARGAPGQGGTP